MKKYLALVLLAAMLLIAVPAQAKECWYYETYGKHDFEQTDVNYATCTTNGYYLLECRQCGTSQKQVTEKAYGHDWEKTVEENATCTKAGFTEYSCRNCGQVRTEEAKTLGHKYKRVKLLEEASCISKGAELLSCSNCGRETTRSIDKTDHSYGAWQVSVEASDIAKGVRIRSCKVCGTEQKEEYYPDGTLYRGIQDKEAVRDIQQKLLDLGYLNSEVDGIFGEDTERALREFAAGEALPEDGVAWPATQKRLHSVWNGESELTPEPTAEPTLEPTPEPTAEPTAEPAPACCICDENDVWTMCENHALIHETAQTLYQSARNDSGRLRVLGQVRVLWESEIDALYEALIASAEDDAALGVILSDRAAFASFLTMQEAMWEMSLGEDAPEVLENVNRALKAQCMQLCGLVESKKVE